MAQTARNTSPSERLAFSDQVVVLSLTKEWRRRWLFALLGCLGLLGVLAICLFWLFWNGVGVWGNNIPVTWALDIVSYDWWIGIATGGLVLAACLVIADQPARGALSRLTETTALFAAFAAAIYPIIHLGRPWFFYWNIPYPNLLDLWPQFRSPLAWDAMAIIAYLGIVVCFWFTGLLPDFAARRDCATGYWAPRLYGIAALGWRGAASHWSRWRQARRLQAWFGLILAAALQAGAAVMFAGTVEPGWHDSLLPVFFFTGAIYSGIAGVAVIAVLLRAAFGLQAVITERHLRLLGFLLLAAGLATTYCYMIEFFNTAYGGDRYELSVLARRATGIYGWSFWLIVAGALLPFHLLWLPRLRASPVILAVVSLLALGGLWMDHFMVIVVTLHHDFLTSSQHFYTTSIWAVGTFVGTIGLFGTLLLVFIRLLPMVSAAEMRRVALAQNPPPGFTRTRTQPLLASARPHV
jgi:Ni/Fe-hydrogenase subunit HybB-like protein